MVIDQGRPATAIGPNGNDSLIVMVPRVRLLEKGDDLGAVTMRPFSGEAGVAKLAWQFIGSVFDEISSLRPQFEAGVVDTICQLVRLAMVESSGEPAMGSQQRVLRERVKACILSHLREPELDADRIATELNCTKRYLHKVFETERVSIGDYIRQLRLDRCRDEILAPEYQDKSITEIAFSWGFNSSSHFSAAFKERFGTAPSLFRKVN
jgi:AraC-like DNA-binding protein